MNASFDEQASSQSTIDQHSDTSSVNLHSPRLPLNYRNSINNNTNSNNTGQPQQSMQNQQERYHNLESAPGPYIFGASGSVFQHPEMTPNHQARPSSSSAIQSNNMPVRRPYTGVDKLIMAAMMEESAAAAAAVAVATGTSSYLPSGRGLGYFSGAREPVTHIPTPSNKSEMELYRLLERANLLNYFGTFLNFGGDDVRQLCDADEDEFLEIMSLVGMTQKPLHVRRLQKALVDWKENKELEQSFRRPSQTSINQLTPSTSACELIPTSPRGCRSPASNQLTPSTSTRQLIPTTPKSCLSPALTSTSPASATRDSGSQSYPVVPHEVIVNAPKRLRLMDDLHRKGRHVEDQSPIKVDISPIKQSNTHKAKAKSSSNGFLSIHRLTSSPKSQKSSTDKDDDRYIEVMNSSCSEAAEAQDETENLKASTSSHTEPTNNISHSKFGRYRASLKQTSQKTDLLNL